MQEQIGSQGRQPIELMPRPTVLDCNVLALNETGFR